MSLQVLAALLPAAVFALTVLAVRPAAAVPAPGRLAVVRAALVTGAFAVGSVEALSASGCLTVAGVVGAWVAALVVAAVAAARRAPVLPRPGFRPLIARWREFIRWEQALAMALGGLVLAELVLALVSPPNTYDSQTYHLPRVEHWVVERSVAPYPVRIHRQVTYPPGAEYLLLHLRLLTGGDMLYGLVQFAASGFCLATATRITVQLGGGRTAQLLAAFVLGTAPPFVLQSSSTQTDLVSAAWAAGLVTVALDGLAGPGRQPTRTVGLTASLLFGCAVGLIAVTKPTGLLLAAAMLVWVALARLRRCGRRAVPGVLVMGLAVIAGFAALAGPQLWRMNIEFGNPLGPDYLRNSVAMQRHDPGALLVNGLRQAHTVFDTPVAALRRAGAAGIEAIAGTVGVDPQDPAITFDSTRFPTVAWYPSEDKASYPVQAALLAVATFAVLVRPGRRVPGPRRALAAILVLATLLHAAVLKWQPWGNRLTLYLVVLAAPVAGIWLASTWRALRRDTRRSGRACRRALAWATVLAALIGGAAGWMSVGYGWPRRLLGHRSVFVLDNWDARFVTRPDWADDYATVGAAVRSSGARRIGLVQSNDSWEYPWWLLFQGRELVALQSQMPKHPPRSRSHLDALVCATPPEVCRPYAPPTWTFRTVGTLSYALPPIG